MYSETLMLISCFVISNLHPDIQRFDCFFVLNTDWFWKKLTEGPDTNIYRWSVKLIYKCFYTTLVLLKSLKWQSFAFLLPICLLQSDLSSHMSQHLYWKLNGFGLIAHYGVPFHYNVPYLNIHTNISVWGKFKLTIWRINR